MQNLTSLTQSSAGNITCSKNFTVTGTTTMNGTVDLTGATVTGLTATASAVSPDADDGAALGTTALKWSDLFLASGAVINFNSGNVTLTHSAGTLTMSADQFVLGAFSSATAGSGNALSSTVTGTMKIYGDDAGAAMTGNIRNFLSRVLLTVDHPGDLSVRGAMGQIKLNDGVDLTQGYANGVEGYIEMAGTNNIGATSNVAAVSGIVELTTASTITSGGSLAGVVASYSSAATPTGNCAGFLTQVKSTAVWPKGLFIPSGTATQAICVGTSASKITLTAGSPHFEMYTTCASTNGSTSAEPFLVNSTMTGAGGVGGRAKFYMTTNVALGGWSNALKSHAVYGANGSTTGLGSSFCAEMDLSAGTSSGTYAPLEIELNLGSGASTGTATSFIHCSTQGDGVAAMDGAGFFFTISGVSSGATNLWYDHQGSAPANVEEWLRVKTPGGTRYLALYDAVV